MSNPSKPTIHLGADHGGFELKEQLKKWLEEQGYSVEDHGAHTMDPNDDYPEPAFAVAEAVAEHESENAKGVLLCRSGGGVTIAANKVKGVRAVTVNAPQEADHAVTNNNANIIALAADWLTPDQSKEALKVFLETPFTGEERHQRRINQISAYERNHAALPGHSD